MKNRRTGSVAAVAGVLAVASLVAAPGTQAATASCPLNQLCVWQNASFSGGKATWFSGDTAPLLSGMTYSNGASLNNSISSVYNNTSRIAYLYLGSSCTGTVELVPHNTTVPQVTFNDQISSLSISGSSSC